ncbi:hypothetical protein [Butyrivibrio sp. FCS006]|uniref:hypothetical protein n=1 Tax=Butyrivibrio sp. FCS006 TaxID=1280684 RepID=UPI0003FBCADA|nr:hypothetical protein [Butyrivibrio sp. FCS006]
MNKKKLLVIVILVLLLVPIYFMEIDHFIFGDEVITYNMANNKEAGFVFSEGRISDYLRTEVFSGKDGIIKSIASMGKDLIKHKANAQILNYPRDKEVRLYEAEEVKGWFYKAEEDRFDFFNTWIHSLSDDANPWGYYELVNLSSSIFPEISGTKWSAFLVNILFYLGNLLILLAIGKKTGNTYYQNIAMIIFVGVVSTILTNSVTTLRPYAVASFWATSFAYASICMLERVMANEAIASKHLIGIVALYVLGYITHYTMGIVLLSFGITLLFYTNVFYKKNPWIIFSTGMAAFILGLFFHLNH